MLGKLCGLESWSHLCWRLGCEFWGCWNVQAGLPDTRIQPCGCRWEMGLPVWEWKQVCCLSPARRHLSFWVLPPPLCLMSNVSVPSLLPTMP